MKLSASRNQVDWPPTLLSSKSAHHQVPALAVRTPDKIKMEANVHCGKCSTSDSDVVSHPRGCGFDSRLSRLYVIPRKQTKAEAIPVIWSALSSRQTRNNTSTDHWPIINGLNSEWRKWGKRWTNRTVLQWCRPDPEVKALSLLLCS